MIDWMNPSDDILDARKIGYQEGLQEQEELTGVLQHQVEQLETRLAQAETERDQLKAENERLRKERLDFENREGAICPEDVGFEEYIRTLEKRVEELEKELNQDAICDKCNELKNACICKLGILKRD